MAANAATVSYVSKLTFHTQLLIHQGAVDLLKCIGLRQEWRTWYTGISGSSPGYAGPCLSSLFKMKTSLA